MRTHNTHTYARTHKYTMHARMYVHTTVHTHACTQCTLTRTCTHTHIHTHTHLHAHTHTNTHVRARTHTRVHTHVGAAHRARSPSHRLALCLLICVAPLALLALGLISWFFLNLGLVTVQYGSLFFLSGCDMTMVMKRAYILSLQC